MSDWTYDSLFAKSQLYLGRALAADRESVMFPFWCSLALEFIGRSTLAKIHPVLIADPREGSNILHAFGYPPAKSTPKTIGAKTVFLRLQRIVPEFTPKEESFCNSMIEKRNEELHTGTPAFENYNSGIWLTHFYASVNILIQHQGLTLDQILGADEAKTAVDMIDAYNTELIGKVKKRIGSLKAVLEEWSEQELAEAEENAEVKKTEFVLLNPKAKYSKNETCPCCGNQGIILGSYISTSDPIAGEDSIEEKLNIMPLEFLCFVCNFKLRTYGELLAVDFGGQFTIKKNFDPIEYYNIDPIEAAEQMGVDLLEAAKERGYDFSDAIEEDMIQRYIEMQYDYGND